MMDLSTLNLQDLRQLQLDIEKEMGNRDKRDIEAARDAIYKIAHDRKLSITQLLELTGLVKPNGKLASGAPAKVKGEFPAKYRNPANPEEEWSGRGRQPNWFKAATNAGVAPETLLANQ